ncbi:MAG: hypothetical protein WBK76_05590 [Candidatus Saccharimonadales bacterium]
MSVKPLSNYENNPFMIGIEGLKLIFTQAKSVGIYAIVVTSVLFIFATIASIVSAIIDEMDGRAQEQSYSSSVSSLGEVGAVLAIIFVAMAVYFVVALLLFGVLEHAAATVAKGGQTTLKQSFNALIKVFPSYLWLYLLITVKVLLWSLLFIIPGIIMMNRYILSGTVFFAEGKRGNAAIRRSSELVKGGWLTTYGGTWAWNLISQGLATFVFWPGCVAVLYRQLSETTDQNQPKPPAHVLSWLLLMVPAALFVALILGVILLAIFLYMAGL